MLSKHEIDVQESNQYSELIPKLSLVLLLLFRSLWKTIQTVNIKYKYQ